jgi:hypothetical protein
VIAFDAPDVQPDLSRSYEFQPGTSFPLTQNPLIRVLFDTPVSISTVALEPSYKNRTTNIIKFSYYYVTSDGKQYTDPKTGLPLIYTGDLPSNLTVQHDIINNLLGLNLTILQTSGGTPTFFRLKVLGCYKPSMFF